MLYHLELTLSSAGGAGSHWMWEIVSMLTQGSETLSPGVMQHVDYFPVDMLDALPSPRVLSTHMPFSRVPRDFLSCDCKLIWVVRNPWDVAVSYYHFIKNISVFQYTGQWSGFFDLFLDGSSKLHLSQSSGICGLVVNVSTSGAEGTGIEAPSLR